MTKIAVLTATRAEYGLLRPIISKLSDCGEFDVRIAVTGAHLSPEFGLTYNEIIDCGMDIDRRIEILLSSDTPVGISKSMGLAIISFAEYFEETKPDALMVLGDRYETLAVCCAAMNMRIPIIHLYGGETTEGAVDEAIRHSVTKMSWLHFTSTEAYAKRVIQLGEEPSRVFCVGAMGVENALGIPLLSKEELEQSINFSLDKKYAVLTFHPVTLEEGSAKQQFGELLDAISKRGDLKYIITKANADADGRIINQMTDDYVRENKNAVAFDSLGVVRYLSALKHAAFVIGNSSSGILEAPAFHIPTVNIGDRQRGRLCADSVINCAPVSEEIVAAMDKALSKEFAMRAANAENPYGNGGTSDKIVAVLRDVFSSGNVNLKKKFYDVNFEIKDMR